MTELVVLDVAGTTLDDAGTVYDALAQAAEATRGTPLAPGEIAGWLGTDKREALRALIGGTDGAEVSDGQVEAAYADFAARLAEAYRADPPQPFPGVVEALAELRGRGVRVALSTGFSRDVVDPLLASVGWTPGEPGSPVDVVVCTDDVPAGRPAPYMIFRAMELTGTHDVAAVAVAGDTHVDLRAGTHAGVAHVVGVLTGALDATELGRAPHTALLDSVADLPALLAG